MHKPLEKTKLELKDLSKQSSKVFTKITCPSCDSAVSAENLNINDKIGKCGSCDVVFPFHESISGFSGRTKVSQELIRPEGIDLFHFQDELEISIKGQPLADVLDITILILATISFLVLEILLLTGSLSLGMASPFLMLIGYAIYAHVKRKKALIQIVVDDQQVSTQWRPKKFIKDKAYPIHEIDQIYINSQHQLMMIVNGDDGQKHVKLIPKIGSLTKAKYLEQEIEKHLGITDRKVPEEV